MVLGLNHVIVVWFVPSCYPGSASSAPLHGFDGIRIHPYHYQMHQKVVKHFIYVPWLCNPVWSGSWPQSWHIGMVCTQLFSRFSLLNPPPWLWWTRDTFIWPSTELEGSSTLYIYIWDGSVIQSEVVVLGRNHVIVVLFVPSCYTGLGSSTHLHRWAKDTSIPLSTASEGARLSSLHIYDASVIKPEEALGLNPIATQGWALQYPYIVRTV